MKKSIAVLTLITSFTLLTGFFYSSNQKYLTGKLIRINQKDTVYFKTVTLSDNQVVSLKTCIENFHYPPSLPKDIYLTKPDTTEMSNKEKEEIMIKYIFDDQGRIIEYFYHGSLISGIFPWSYKFSYEPAIPNRILTLTNSSDKSVFKLSYNESNEIILIEKFDTLIKKTEILLPEIK